MKKLKSWLKDIFEAEDFGNLNMGVIGEALGDPSVREVFLRDCLDELKRIHLDIDKRLLSGSEMGLIDLCARRRACQDVMESILSARRSVKQDVRHNPRFTDTVVDLDRVTA